MNILGVLLFLAGAVCAGLFYFGYAPQALLNIPLSPLAWLGISVAGAVILYFNRRPSD